MLLHIWIIIPKHSYVQRTDCSILIMFLLSTVAWSYENAAFGDVPVFALKQQDNNWPGISYTSGGASFNYPAAVNYLSLYVGTFGNGAYVTRDFVGFEEIESKKDNLSSLTAYPNPATDHMTISFMQLEIVVRQILKFTIYLVSLFLAIWLK